MPLGYGKTFYDPAVNWNYKTEPDPGPGRQCRPLAARQAARRFEFDQRHGVDQGPPADYDDWRDQGNPGWGFDDLLPAFKAIEDNAGRRRSLARCRRAAACDGLLGATFTR